MSPLDQFHSFSDNPHIFPFFSFHQFLLQIIPLHFTIFPYLFFSFLFLSRYSSFLFLSHHLYSVIFFPIFYSLLGLHGVFPVDAAVYYNDKLAALVEIDGEFHYKQLGQLLRRKDRMKEFLYKHHYPTLPLFRIRSDQCTVIGVQRAGKELACWISSLVTAKELEDAKTV